MNVVLSVLLPPSCLTAIALAYGTLTKEVAHLFKQREIKQQSRKLFPLFLGFIDAGRSVIILGEVVRSCFQGPYPIAVCPEVNYRPSPGSLAQIAQYELSHLLLALCVFHGDHPTRSSEHKILI